MAPPSWTTTDEKVGLTLLVRFSDEEGDPPVLPPKFSREDIEVFLNEENWNDTQFGNPGSVRDYFYVNSNGRLSYTNVVLDYITVPYTKRYYEYAYSGSDAYDRAVEIFGRWIEYEGYDWPLSSFKWQTWLLIHDTVYAMTNNAAYNYPTEILPVLSSLFLHPVS